MPAAPPSPVRCQRLQKLQALLAELRPGCQPAQPAPADAVPGSEAKIQILQSRLAAGLPLWHPADPKLPEGQKWFLGHAGNGRVVKLRLDCLTGQIVEASPPPPDGQRWRARQDGERWLIERVHVATGAVLDSLEDTNGVERFE